MSKHDETAARAATGAPPEEHDCGSCAIAPDRRAFLRSAAAAAGAALIALGARPADAMARPLAFVSALGGDPRRRTYAIPASDGAVIDRDNDVILVRWQGALYAFNLSCPHQNTALRWEEDEHRFQCPKHHSKYQPDGTFISGRATRSMDRFPITRGGGGVAVDTDNMLRQDQDPAAWAAAVLKV